MVKLFIYELKLRFNTAERQNLPTLSPKHLKTLTGRILSVQRHTLSVVVVDGLSVNQSGDWHGLAPA